MSDLQREMFIDNGTAVKVPEGELKEAVEVDPLSGLEAEESMNPAVAKKLAKALQRLVSA